MSLFELINLIFWWVPEATIIDWRDVEVLSDSRYPGRNTINDLARRESHGDLDHGVVGNSTYTRAFRRNITFPDTERILGHWVGSLRPAICM